MKQISINQISDKVLKLQNKIDNIYDKIDNIRGQVEEIQTNIYNLSTVKNKIQKKRGRPKLNKIKKTGKKRGRPKGSTKKPIQNEKILVITQSRSGTGNKVIRKQEKSLIETPVDSNIELKSLKGYCPECGSMITESDFVTKFVILCSQCQARFRSNTILSSPKKPDIIEDPNKDKKEEVVEDLTLIDIADIIEKGKDE